MLPLGTIEQVLRGKIVSSLAHLCQSGAVLSLGLGRKKAVMMIEFKSADFENPTQVCVIAEIGVNHDGDVAKAIELTEAAKEAGADAVKLQMFDPDLLLSKQAVLADYQKNQGQTDVHSMLKDLELALSAINQIQDRARSLGLGFIVTPFSLEHVNAIAELDVDAIKIASPDVVNLPLIKACCELGKPMFVSTGTADLEEIAPAASLLQQLDQACLLHCVSSYPTLPEDAALGAIGVIGHEYCLPVGYSDHTTQLTTGALAVAAGACVIEKHITYDCKAQGPDHAASTTPADFAIYVKNIREAQLMLGKREKAVSEVERQVRQISRQSVCISRDLLAGHELKREDLTLRRPGSGIPAMELEKVVGQILGRDVMQHNLLRYEDLAMFK